jgi:hypothetical protein
MSFKVIEVFFCVRNLQVSTQSTFIKKITQRAINQFLKKKNLSLALINFFLNKRSFPVLGFDEMRF